MSDSGSGISEGDQASVFTRFSQGCAKDYTQYGGSGLGLYICRALVEVHGGLIGFQSTFGIGSTFAFCIRAKRLPPISLNLPSKSMRKGSLSGIRNREALAGKSISGLNMPTKDLHILIVEDNLINQKVLSKQLKKAGHAVDIANHGKECLEFLANSHFCKTGGGNLSVVLMDVEMPVMNGVDCTKEIRRMEKEGSINGHVPIIATTGNARNEKVELIKGAGVDSVILKPYSVPDLLRLVEELIAKSKN